MFRLVTNNFLYLLKMSVELKIKVEENCGAIYFFDATCAYSKCNKTGWGRPNKGIEGAYDAKLFVYPPKTDTPIEIALSADFPSLTVLGYEILPEDLGLEKITSGIWRFDYQIRDCESVLMYTSLSKLLYDEVACCVYKSMSTLEICDFDSEKIKDSNLAYMKLEAAKDAACNGLVKEAQKIIDHLHVKCNCGCK